MTRKKRTSVAILLMILLLALICAACGGDTSAPGGSDNSSQAEITDITEVPDFHIEPEGVLVLVSDHPDHMYEIQVNGQDWGVYSPGEVANLWLTPNDAVRIRIVDATTGAPGPWSEEQIYQQQKLELPQVSIDTTGKATIAPAEGVSHYRVRNELTGEEMIFGEDFFMVPNTPYVFCAISDGSAYRLDSDYTQPIQFEVESITFSTTENTLDNLVDNGDGTYTLTAYSNKGNAFRFLVEGEFTPTDNGWGIVNPDSYISSLDAIPGIIATDFTIPMETYVPMAWSEGFELDGNDSVTSPKEVDNWLTCFGTLSGYHPSDAYPNYFAIGDKQGTITESYVLEQWTLYFDGIETQFDHCTIHDLFNSVVYLPGSHYIPQDMAEQLNIIGANSITYMLQLHYRHGDQMSTAIDYFDEVTIGALKNAAGEVIADPQNYYLQAGDVLEVTLNGGLTVEVPLVKEVMTDAQNSNASRPFSYSNTTGTMNTLVIPFYWSDQADRATDQNMDVIYRALGNVMDINGQVTVYAPEDPTEPSLSEYYRIASFDQLTINSFVTDWYAFDGTEADYRDLEWQNEYEQIYQWVKDTYPNLDLSRFDSDRDGILDEIVFINTGDMTGYTNYSTLGFSGAYRNTLTYGGEETPTYGTPNEPAIYHYVSMNLGFLFQDLTISSLDTMETEVMIHEFGHSLGLSDYYDTGYGGISCLGDYDMQDGSKGDWNVYSKYTAGWITPTVVEDDLFANADTVEFSLRSSALTGDALLIPAAGYDYNGTPYDEYMMVDLFTPDGLHAKDSVLFGLDEAVGVRIYHVSDLLEKRSFDENGQIHTFAVQHHTNSSNSAWNQYFGIHQLEIISATGKNRFAIPNNEDREFQTKDLFTAGDTFAAEDFEEFFYQGKMDNGLPFGYEITVTSITQENGEYLATIAVTRTDN